MRSADRIHARQPIRPYLIVASAPHVSPVAPDHDVRGNLLLSSANGVDTVLAQTLDEHLRAAGQRSSVAVGVTPARMETVLKDARAQQGKLHNIVLLDGWGADATDDQVQLDRQVQRCAMAAAIIQACERTDTAATVWLLTRNAGIPMGASHANGQSIADAALWGYGRTLANEASNYRVRMVDLPGDAPAIAALVREMRYPDAEDEILLDANGERLAPRLRLVARPAPAAQEIHKPAHRLGFEFPGNCATCAGRPTRRRRRVPTRLKCAFTPPA
ncbi:hypothetical protein WJ972_29850 [Achromobacter insuavis]